MSPCTIFVASIFNQVVTETTWMLDACNATLRPGSQVRNFSQVLDAVFPGQDTGRSQYAKHVQGPSVGKSEARASWLADKPGSSKLDRPTACNELLCEQYAALESTVPSTSI